MANRRRRKADPEKAKRKREKARLAYIERLKAEGTWVVCVGKGEHVCLCVVVFECCVFVGWSAFLLGQRGVQIQSTPRRFIQPLTNRPPTPRNASSTHPTNQPTNQPTNHPPTLLPPCTHTRPVRPEQEARPGAVDRQEPALLQQARCVHKSTHACLALLGFALYVGGARGGGGYALPYHI
jgi:hypothetical protein